MNFREALAWLYGAQTFGIKLGLDNTRRLLAAAGNPHEGLKFLHVAGTNGKGSTCAMLDAICREGGMKSGLYTSPHLVDFRERIRVGGEMIPAASVAAGLGMLRDACAGWDHQPTFFEIATVLAAWWFARAGAEIVIWETGLGGRLDATNAIIPLVSVITPIAHDHQQWLGDSLAAIAREKAGIIKPGIPVVSAPQVNEAREVICAVAEEAGSPLVFVEESCEGVINLAGVHQRWNASTALAALDAADLVVSASARARGLASVQWPARFQRMGHGIVLDGAHNVSAAEALVRTWREAFGKTKARLVFGALRDKHPGEVLHVLRGIADEVVLVSISNDRAVPAVELRAVAESCGFLAIREGTLGEVLADEPPRPTLITGSLFLAGEALAIMENSQPPLPSNQ